MKRKIVVSLLALVILLCLGHSASADETHKSGRFSYTILGNGNAKITGYKWKAWSEEDEDVYVPSLLDGHSVTEIGENAFRCNRLRRGTYAFTKYDYDEFVPVKVILPDTIQKIGAYAFWNANLSEINFPESLSEVGYGAFVGNPVLQFKVANTHPYFSAYEGALYKKSTKELIAYPLYYERYQQYRNQQLSIPEGIVSIGDYAFYRCIDSEEPLGTRDEKYFIDSATVVLPSTLKSIGNYAFYGFNFDRRSDNIVFPESLEEIGISAFENSNSYFAEEREFYLSSNFKTLGVRAFANMRLNTYGKSATFVIDEESGLTIIPDSAFLSTGLTITIKAKGIQAIENNAFNGARVTMTHVDNVKELGINNSCTISDAAGNNFFPLIDTIPAGCGKTITGNEYYYWSDSNPSGSVPSTVKRIEEGAFGTVSDLKLPASLEHIDEHAFGEGSSFIVEADSYAERWVKENGYQYNVEGAGNALDWLNN